jgi:aspartate oxidase
MRRGGPLIATCLLVVSLAWLSVQLLVAPPPALVASHSTATARMPADAPITVAVVGSGLAGLSCTYELSQALQARDQAARVVLLEKASALGGNSAKASSGINSVTPELGDSAAAYAADTLQSGGGLSARELVDTLVVRRVS